MVINNITLVDNTRAKIDFGIYYILAPNETGKYFENVFFDWLCHTFF